MISDMQYRGILEIKGQELFAIENNCPNRILVSLTCKLEDEYHDAKALVIKKSTGQIIYQCRRQAIC